MPVRSFTFFVALSGCVVQPTGGSSTTPPPGEGGGGAPAGQTIEAGCSYNGTQLQGEIGAEFQVSCPANCQSEGGSVWGSDTYTLDSNVCKAGIHAGAITPQGGVVGVRIEPGLPAYRGSAKNGIQTGDYGQFGKSFVVTNGQAGPPAAGGGGAPGGGAGVIEAGCSFNATQIVGEIGTRHVVACPAGCSGTGATWGTDAYTADSTICRAAVHAGLLTDQGGNVAVVLDPGRPAYRGSTKNGIQSSDYGNYPKSYHLERP